MGDYSNIPRLYILVLDSKISQLLSNTEVNNVTRDPSLFTKL